MSAFSDALAAADAVIIDTFKETITLPKHSREVSAAVDREWLQGEFDQGGCWVYSALLSAVDAPNVDKGDIVIYKGARYEVSRRDHQDDSVILEFY